MHPSTATYILRESRFRLNELTVSIGTERQYLWSYKWPARRMDFEAFLSQRDILDRWFEPIRRYHELLEQADGLIKKIQEAELSILGSK